MKKDHKFKAMTSELQVLGLHQLKLEINRKAVMKIRARRIKAQLRQIKDKNF